MLQRQRIREWLAQQLEQWSLSSYLSPTEAENARKLAEEIREEAETTGHDGIERAGSSTSSTGTTTESPEGT